MLHGFAVLSPRHTLSLNRWLQVIIQWQQNRWKFTSGNFWPGWPVLGSSDHELQGAIWTHSLVGNRRLTRLNASLHWALCVMPVRVTTGYPLSPIATTISDGWHPVASTCEQLHLHLSHNWFWTFEILVRPGLCWETSREYKRLHHRAPGYRLRKSPITATNTHKLGHYNIDRYEII